jgi:hypothetical protein
MPGLLLCFVMRYDKYKRMQAQAPESESKITYFHCSLIGYVVGTKYHENYESKITYFHCSLIGYIVGKKDPPCCHVIMKLIVSMVTNLLLVHSRAISFHSTREN